MKNQLSAYLKEDSYITKLLALRQALLPVFSNNVFRDFTDHSVSHSDRMVEIINKLISSVPEPKKLSNEELLILFASCYLHDIGMQYEKAGETQVIRKLEIGQEWVELEERTRRDYLRKHHHEISAEIVMMLGPHGNSPLDYRLPSEMMPGYIAALCEAHCVPVKDQRYQELLESVPDIRMPLLSAILRVADILDESCRRISVDKYDTLLLDANAKKHWWRHYYTENISFDAERMEITLHFDFPKDKRDEYRNIIPFLQRPWIQSEFANHIGEFNKAKLNWSINWELSTKPYTTAKPMPEDVLGEMLKELHLQKSKEVEEKRIMVLSNFAAARPYIQRRFDDLSKNKEADDYLLKLWSLAKHMKEIGSIRSSWNILVHEFNRNMQSLTREKQIEIGVWLANTMIEDGCVERAVDVINKTGGLEEGVQDIARLTNLLKTKLKVMLSTFHSDEAKETFLSLYPKVSDPAEKQEILANMCEWSFLNGEWAEIKDWYDDKGICQC